MTEKVAVRRSFRLKDKPAPEYAFRDYLKNQKSYRPREEVERNKKYEDLFSSVVATAFSMDVPHTEEVFDMRLPPKPPRKRHHKKSNSSDSSEGSQEEEDLKMIFIKKAKEPEKSRKIDKKTDLDVEIEEVPVQYNCSCGCQFTEHADCHRHIYEEHGDNEMLADCKSCGSRLSDIRKTNGCPVCSKFVKNLEEHLVSHYRNCTSRNAIMECRFCTKQFKTVKEVVEHEQQKHIFKPPKKVFQQYSCSECSQVYTNQEALMIHYSSHIDINDLSDKIMELQYRVQATKEECPFCRCNVSSRKTFRAHLLKKHWEACKSLAGNSLLITNPEEPTEKPTSDLEIKREVEEMTGSAVEPLKEIKEEVKEEIVDDGYPLC